MDQPQVANPATQSTSDKTKKLLTPSTTIALVIVVIAILLTPNLREFSEAKSRKALELTSVQAAPTSPATPTAEELILLREQKLLQQQQDILTEYADLSTRVQELQASVDELQQLIQARNAILEAAK